MLLIASQSGVVVLGLESDLWLSGVMGWPIYKPDGHLKPVGFGFGFENSPVGPSVGLILHPNWFCCGSGFLSTWPEPDPLSSLVSPELASKLMVGFLFKPQNQGGGGFPDLGLKTDSYGLVIWVSKSPRRFLRLGLKTKQAMVYRLRHKIDGRTITWDARRDLSVCFTWK
jgi:hypothetical protein